jgi:PHD/YefM family antitoxin component YafN of YafNO toxin-antitoxin module
MVTYGSNELISSSELAKKFGSYLSQISQHSIDKLAILKNNKVEAVMLSKDEYEAMCEALKRAEAQELMASIKKGLSDVQAGKTDSIDTLWNKLDD